MDTGRDRRHIGIMEHDADILIAGGGLNGPTLALALAQAGLRVVVVDARPAPARADAAFDGRAYALAAASQRLLAAVGVWPAVATVAQPILRVSTSDGGPSQGGGAVLDFAAGELDGGPLGFMLEDRHLYAATLAAIGQEVGVSLLSGRAVVDQQVTPGGVVVTLDDGARLTGRLLVGCDGRASGVAARAGIRRVGRDYGQTALVGALRPEHAHEGVAHQVFLPGGPLAILPLRDGRVSIVWAEARAAATEIAALSDDDYLNLLHQRIGHITGAITLAGPRFAYPLTLTLAEEYVRPRLALVGDAAHGVHPVAGQGLNLGLRDVAALAEVLVAAWRRGEDIGALDVLLRYQRWRRSDATLLALGMDGVTRLFSTTNPLAVAARGIGMRAVAALAGPRRFLMREAAGLGPDLPRLLQGKRL